MGETQYTAWGAVDLRKLGSSGSPVLLTDYVYYSWTTANGRGRLSEIKTGTSGNPISLQDLDYQYDAVGNVAQIDDYKAGFPQTQSFSYDALNRLKTAQASGGTYGDYGQDAYLYSFSGNLTSKAGRTQSYTDTLHAHAVGATSNGDWYKYDANGNMITRTVGADTFALTYDVENRLTEAKKNGTTIATFAYDGDGKRVKATVDGTTTVYVGDYYEVGATTKKYYSIGGVRVAMYDNNTLRYLLGDHLGSTAITADSSGSLSSELRYKAWGDNRYTNGTTLTTYHFTGQREESGLGAGVYFYQARWYDSGLGRFLQADTIVPGAGNPQAYNRYAYVLNNPLRFMDPTGHAPCDGEETCGKPRPPRPYSLAESNQEADMLVSEWLWETGPGTRTFGPDDSMTQDIMFGDRIGKFYEAWAAAGWVDNFEYQDQIEGNRSDLGSWGQAFTRGHKNRFTAEELERRGINVSPGSPYDKIDTTIGSYDTIKTSRYDQSLIKVEVTNSMNWKSGLRVGNFAPVPDVPRSVMGPGGTTTQRFYWFAYSPAKAQP